MEQLGAFRAASLRVVLTVGMLAGASCTEQEAAPTPETWQVTLNDQASGSTSTTLPEEVCIEPTQQEIQTVSVLVDSPPTDESFYDPADSLEQTLQKVIANKIAEAAEHNLTVRNTEAYLLPMKVDMIKITESSAGPNVIRQIEDDGSRLTIEEYLELTRQALDLYGIELIVNDEANSINQILISKSDLTPFDNTKTREALINMLDTLLEMPVELLDHTGLNKIVLTDVEREDAAAFVSPQGLPGVMFVDPEHYLGIRTYMHELYHLLDNELCGADMYTDEVFEALNPEDVYGVERIFPTRDNTLQQSLDLIQRRYDAQAAGDLELEAQLIQELAQLDASIVAPNDYALTEAHEDKAETGASFLTGYDFTVFDPASPIVRRKAEYLLARLYQLNPAIVSYLVDKAHRNYTDAAIAPN